MTPFALLFGVGIVCKTFPLLLFLPLLLAEKRPPQRLCSGEDDCWGTLSLRGWCALRYALGFGCWLVPVVLEALNAFGII